MPATFTRRPIKIRKQSGSGGRPPVDRSSSGGGGGGGDDNWNPSRGPRELLTHIRLFVFSALGADITFFGIVVAIFLLGHGTTEMDPRTHMQINLWHPLMLPPILALNTAVLLLSCLTMEMARRNIFSEIDVLEEWLGLGQPALRRARPWMWATLGLGGLFLAGQAVAWKQLAGEGFAFDRWSPPASYLFYLITGLHAAHLLIGVAALVLCTSVLGRFRRVEYRQVSIDATAWYWHTMGLAWLILLAVLTLGQ